MNCCNGWTTECFSCVREAAIIYCNYYDHSGPGDESNDKIGPRDENSDKCDIKQGKRVSGQIEWVLKWLTPAKQCQAALSYEPSREIPAWKSDLDCPAFFFLFNFIFIVCLLLHSCCVANLTSPSNTCTVWDHVRKQGKTERRRGRKQLRQHWPSNQAIWNCSDWKSWATSWSFRTEPRFPHYTPAPIRITGVQRVCGATSHGAFSSTSAVLALLRSRLRDGGTTSPFQQIAAPRCFDWRLFKSNRPL